MILGLILLSLLPSSFAAGGFEKPVLWSARAVQHGGAYSSSVSGAEALFFNPASLKSEHKQEWHLGISAAAGTSKAPLIEDQKEETTFSGPVTPLGIMYGHQLNDREAVAIGLYSVGGLDVGFDDVKLSSLGNEFGNYRPDIFGRLAIIELGLGYGREINENFSAGISLRQNYARGGFSQVQVSRARGLGGFGIPDDTVLAVSRGEFDDLEGFSLGNYLLGVKYLSDAKTEAVSITYRSRLLMELKTKAKGEVVYSNAGAAVSGANAGQVYRLQGSQTTISSTCPEAWTVSAFKQVSTNNKAHFEYTWTEYSDNSELSLDGKLTNPVDGTTTPVPDVNLQWHDLHDFKFGWTNTSVEKWILGGGYSISLPVTDKKHTGPTFAAPANYHHLYFGAGRAFSTFRVDSGLEYYFAQGTGKSQRIDSANQYSPSIGGDFETRAYAFFLSTSWYL